jgi:toxin ParE1/3/4
MNVRWTPQAAADLERIGDYIAEDNPDAALQTVRSLFSRIQELTAFPLRGRIGREEAVGILHIHHGARNRLPNDPREG